MKLELFYKKVSLDPNRHGKATGYSSLMHCKG